MFTAQKETYVFTHALGQCELSMHTHACMLGHRQEPSLSLSFCLMGLLHCVHLAILGCQTGASHSQHSSGVRLCATCFSLFIICHVNHRAVVWKRSVRVSMACSSLSITIIIIIIYGTPSCKSPEGLQRHKDTLISSQMHAPTCKHSLSVSLSLTHTRTHTNTTHALQIRITKWPHHLSPVPSPAAVNNTRYAAESFVTFDYFLFLCVLCCVNLEQPFSFPFFLFLVSVLLRLV